MKLKFCGIRTQEMYNFCLNYGVDFIGLNFVESSKRKLINPIDLRHGGTNVGVFQDQSTDFILKKIQPFTLNIIQLHGHESASFCQKLKRKTSAKIWKAFPVDIDFRINMLSSYKPFIDLFLFDGHNPGSGKTISQKMKQKVDEAITFCENHQIKYGIAGGINKTNVASFVRQYPKAYVLDLASGIETNGKFDPQIAQQIIRTLRNCKNSR